MLPKEDQKMVGRFNTESGILLFFKFAFRFSISNPPFYMECCLSPFVLKTEMLKRTMIIWTKTYNPQKKVTFLNAATYILMGGKEW